MENVFSNGKIEYLGFKFYIFTLVRRVQRDILKYIYLVIQYRTWLFVLVNNSNTDQTNSRK